MTFIKTLKKTTQSLRRSRLAQNESGVAAMEFAIIAPMIIGLYLGLAELSTVLSVERKVSHSASVAGDLATQVSSLDETDAEDLVSAVLQVANLGETGNYILRLQSYYRRPNGNVASEGVIIYRNGRHGGLSQYDKNSLSEDLLPIGGGIVVASVKHAYTPFGFARVDGEDKGKGFLPNQLDLEETFLLKPRRSSTVVIGDGGTHTRFLCTGSANNVRCSRS